MRLMLVILYTQRSSEVASQELRKVMYNDVNRCYCADAAFKKIIIYLRRRGCLIKDELNCAMYRFIATQIILEKEICVVL